MKIRLLLSLTVFALNVNAQNYFNTTTGNPGNIQIKHDGSLDIGSIYLRKNFQIFSNEEGKTHRRLTFNTNNGSNSYIYNFDPTAESFHTINIGGRNSLSSGISIFGNGNVGIGVASTNYKLDVLGRIKSDQLFTNWLGVYSTAEGKTNRRVTVTASMGGHALLYYVDKDDDSFHTINIGGSNSLNNGITILGNGNVGIGTSTVGGHMLAVDGSIGAREIQVETTTWADYVFNDEYKLKELEDVEDFIKENNHLPDIPSKKEVIENGIALGEMNAKLLQKIEELTLYMIDQHKETKLIKAQLDKLAKENEELKAKIKN